MARRLEETLARVFSGVLADFAYMFGDCTASDALPELEGRGFVALLTFRGDLAGSIAVAVPESLAIEIAANTLGVEPGDPEASRGSEDAVRELASLIGGHMATSFAGRIPQVDLDPPKLFILDGEDWDRLRTNPATQCFSINERPALLCVQVKQGGVPA